MSVVITTYTLASGLMQQGMTWWQSMLTILLGNSVVLGRLVLDDLFRERGAYSYRNGVNWRAVAAFVIGILPVVPGFARAAVTPGGSVADPNPFDLLYSYAWFVTFGLSFLVYLVLMSRSSPVEFPGAD